MYKFAPRIVAALLTACLSANRVIVSGLWESRLFEEPVTIDRGAFAGQALATRPESITTEKGPGIATRVRELGAAIWRALPGPDRFAVSNGGLPLPMRFGRNQEEPADVTKAPIATLTGPFPTVGTLQTIFDTLGKFGQGTTIRPLEDSDFSRPSRTGAIPFALDPQGREFFQALFGTDSVEAQAYVLTFQTENEYDQRLLKGLKAIPFGILAKTRTNRHGLVTDETVFLDLTPVFSDKVYSLSLYPSRGRASLAKASLFPGIRDRTRTYEVHVEKYDSMNDESLRQLRAETGHSCAFNLLTLRNPDDEKDEPLFSPRHPQSRDFQETLWTKHSQFQGHTVGEYGTGGYAINALWSAVFGATAYDGVETFVLGYVCGLWNIHFVHETKQIPDIPIRLKREGRASGQILLFNSGVIFPDDADQPDIDHQKAVRKSAFLSVMDNIGADLRATSQWAFIRVRAVLNSHLVQVEPHEYRSDMRDQVEMDRRWQTIIGGKEESAYQRLTVEKFMTNMGLAWETVRKYSDLVFIFKKRADSADSSQANPRAEGGPGLDSRQPETGHHRQGEILRAA